MISVESAYFRNCAVAFFCALSRSLSRFLSPRRHPLGVPTPAYKICAALLRQSLALEAKHVGRNHLAGSPRLVEKHDGVWVVAGRRWTVLRDFHSLAHLRSDEIRWNPFAPLEKYWVVNQVPHPLYRSRVLIHILIVVPVLPCTQV